jgi:hypothetical protein
MTGRRLGASVAAFAVVLTGCGSASSPASLDAARVPLLAGARIIAQARDCDLGAKAYCAVEFVVVDPNYTDSYQLLIDERTQLLKSGWFGNRGDTGDESAVDSPDHHLRLTYAMASKDLQAMDLGWIQRAWPMWLALSRTMYARSAALSMMLERATT